MPKISIIMPVFNSEMFIRQSLESIFNQRYSNLELIVVDSQSTDNSISIVEEFMDNNIKLISEQDFGLWHALNKGIMMSSGEYIACMNTDDMYFENALIKIGQHLMANKDIDLLYAEISRIDEAGKFLSWHLAQKYDKHKLLNHRCYIPYQACFFR